tara:strand:+ start:181 stop:1101 length:921 start_codon:yes stop_codon:yes gene_type:complete
MFVFKNIDKEATSVERKIVDYTQNLTTASVGIETIKIVSGSISNSYWDSLNLLFYTSGSPEYTGETKFSLDCNNLTKPKRRGKQYLTKFHGYPSSSIVTIPSHYYTEKIKERTFQLTEKSITDNSSNNPIIKDDGNGNLYSTNANSNFGTLTASNSSISSSDNYVGNIFYEYGLAIITETGSWSGSVNYSDFSDYNIKFDSFSPITTREYQVTIKPKDFNKSMNYSLRMPLKGTYDTSSLDSLSGSILANQYYAQEFTSSNFTPYITTINLYQRGDYDTPVMIAKLPRPIKKSDKISTTFKIRIDI